MPWRASGISAANPIAKSCPGADPLHVDCAVKSAADLFVSSNDQQFELAKAAGSQAVRPV